MSGHVLGKNVKWAALALAGVALAGCEANGGSTFGGGGDNGGFADCLGVGTSNAEVFVAPDFGAGCLACSVTGAENLKDGNPDTAAEVDLTLGLLDGRALVQVRAPDNVVYDAGNIAGYVVRIPGADLLSAVLLPSITIETKLDLALQEEETFSNILALDLLGLLQDDGKFFVGFQTTKPFDNVAIQVGIGVLSALRVTELYAACGDAAGPGLFPAAPL